MSVIAKYTLPAISGSHADFPLLLKWADFSAEAIASINDGGGNLRFYSDNAGSNGLPCEVVTFDKTNSKAQVYVKIPNAATGSVVYIGVDGASQPETTDPLGRNAVWSDYLISSHFKSNFDSVDGMEWDTSGAQDAHITSDGIIGDGYEFDGSYRDVITLEKANGKSENYTASFWYTYGGSNSLSYMFTLEGKTTWYSFSITQNWDNIDGVRTPVLYAYSRNANKNMLLAALPDLGVGDEVFVSINYSPYSFTSLIAHDGNLYIEAHDEELVIGNDQRRIRLEHSTDIRIFDEPRMTLPGIVRDTDFIAAEYQNRSSETAWGVMTAVESGPAQEFTSHATLTLDELSINATMASTVPSFESDAHISLDEPQFQSTLSSADPEFTSSAYIELGQPVFQSSSESTVPEFGSIASLTLEPISFSVYMGSAQTISSTASLHINELEFSSMAQSTRPEFTSSAHIETEIQFTSSLSSTEPQFVSYAALQIDDVSFATIEPIPQLENINIPDGAAVVYEAKNNVVTYTPKNSVIIRG